MYLYEKGEETIVATTRKILSRPRKYRAALIEVTCLGISILFLVFVLFVSFVAVSIFQCSEEQPSWEKATKTTKTKPIWKAITRLFCLPSFFFFLLSIRFFGNCVAVLHFIVYAAGGERKRPTDRTNIWFLTFCVKLIRFIFGEIFDCFLIDIIEIFALAYLSNELTIHRSIFKHLNYFDQLPFAESFNNRLICALFVFLIYFN